MNDGTALQAFWSFAIVFGFLLALLIPAFAVEWWKAGAMRRRERRREAIRRYCASVDEQAARLRAACWRGTAEDLQ